MPGRQAAYGIDAAVSNPVIAWRLLLFVVLRAVVRVKQRGYVPKAAADSLHTLYWQPLDNAGSLWDLGGSLRRPPGIFEGGQFRVYGNL